MDNNQSRQKLNDLSEELLHTIWISDPVGATLIGIHEYDDTLGDVSASALLGYGKQFNSYVELLESKVDPSTLDIEKHIDYRIAVSLAYTNYIKLTRQRAWMNNPAAYVSLAVWGCFGLMVREFAPIEDRLRSMLSRMQEIPEMLKVGRSNIASPPRVFVESAIELTDGAIQFFKDSIPEFAQDKNDILRAAGIAATALQDYNSWLRDMLAQNPDGQFAVGKDIYEQLLFAEHYLTYSPNDLVRLAKGMLDESQEEIIEVAKKIDPSVSWPELIVSLKNDHPSPDSLLYEYREAVDSSRRFTAKRDLVSIPENALLDVLETPVFERSMIPYAAYLPAPPFESDRRGILWVTPVDQSAPSEQQESKLMGHCLYTIPITALHEGYPGHHLQFTLAAGSESPIRKQSQSNLVIEGWALYCEQMMHDEGFYTDSRMHLFQLKDLIWRACRVIIDVWLHTEQMTFDEAVHMLVDVAHLEQDNAVAEVKRYCMSPTQPMTYLIGKMLIFDMRERMKRRMGSGFSLKAFHDDLLKQGSISPPLISQILLGAKGRGQIAA